MYHTLLRPRAETVVIEPWYLSGGIAAANCKAAYKAIGAASLAASYVNLANPGTNDAAPGVAPTFNAATGWAFNGVDQYLNTGLDAGSTWSFLVRFSDLGEVTYMHAIFGQFGFANKQFGLTATIPNNIYIMVQQLAIGIVTSDTSGIYGAAREKGYRNGEYAGEVDIYDFDAVGDTTIFIGCEDLSGDSPCFFCNCKVQALAIYSTTLTPAQMLAVSNAMAALT